MATRDVLTAILMDELAENEEIEQICATTLAEFESQRAIELGLLQMYTSTPESDPVRVEGYAEEIVPLYSPREFQSHFRMERSTFEELSPFMARERTMTVEKRLLSTLWLLGTQESYRNVADRFGISKGTLHLTVMGTCHALVKLMREHIKFPTTEQEWQILEEGFSQANSIPGVVGAIDGTHVPIPAPVNEHRGSFINRKGSSSIVLQVVSDSNLKFLDVYTGWPGSVHDARVYRNSRVPDKLQRLPDRYHILGDSAYPLSAGLLTPYRDNGHLTQQQKKFNLAHGKARSCVERAIGLLKCKFRRMKHLDMLLQHEIPIVISSCCVLHNYILENEEINIEEVETERCEDSRDLTQVRSHDIDMRVGLQKRDQICYAM